MTAGVLVFWLFDALPFQDLPAHAGLIAMRHAYAGSAFEQRYYKLGSFLGPYSIFLALGELFDRALGPLGAVRALGSFPVLATPAALLFARRRLHRDASLWAGFLGVALSFGFLTLLGLASYLLALALFVVALTVFLELLADVDAGAPRAAHRERAFLGLALAVSFAHGHALGVLVLSATATAWVGPAATRARRLVRLRSALPALLPLAWSAWRGGAPPGSSESFELVPAADYQTLLDKLSLLGTPTLMTRSGLDLAVGVAIWAVLLAAMGVTLRDRAAPLPDALQTRRLATAAALVLAGFFALPHAFKWFGFIDGRMVPVFLYLVILGVRRPALGPRLDRGLGALAMAAAFAIPSIALEASRRFQAEARGYEDVLAAVPAGASLLNLPLDPNSDVFTAHPFVHYDKLVATRRDVLVSDVWPDRATALYPTPDNPQVKLPASYNSANLVRIDWASFDLDAWSYVLVRVRPDATPPATPSRVVLVAHAGGWWLYRT